jgi:N-acetylneuraminic acid mutarotase
MSILETPDIVSKNLKKTYLIILSVLFLLLFPTIISAVELSISTDSDLRSGTFQNTVQSDTGVSVELESNGTWNALTWKTPDKTLGPGSAFTSDGSYIYVVRGYGDILLWRYSYITDSWETLTNLPTGAYYGSDIQYLNGYIYIIFGGYQNTFARYSIEDSEWDILNNYPELTYQGASMTTDGTDIYTITSNNSQGFYKYSVADDSWVSLAGTPATLRNGSDLERIGNYIYTPRGNNTTTFYRYDISSNTWDTMANIPGTMNDDVDITSANGYIFISRQYNSTSFYKYEVATDTWTTLTDAPIASRYTGVQYLSSEGVVYFFRGNNDYRFWKYDIDNDEFIGPAEPPTALNTGSDAIYVDGALYVTRGSNTTTFYKYTISTNTWEDLAPALATFNDDVRGFSAGRDIYFLRGSNTLEFYKYNIASNSWSSLADAPNTVRYGSALAYLGDDYIYVTRGNNTYEFWRYSISGNTWDTSLATIPTEGMAHIGATLLSDGNDIYFTSGYGVKRMFKYSISLDSWEEITTLPYSPYYGSDTTYDGNGHILAISGQYGNSLWEYSISDEAWRKLESFNSYGPTEIGAWTGASIVSDLNGTAYVTRGGNRQDMMAYVQGSTAYDSYGVWTSPTYDLMYVESWGELVADTVINSDSQVSVETRSSSDGITWSSWESLSGSSVPSLENRYFQVRALLISSSDQNNTPLWGGFTLNYISDTNSPSDLSSITAFSQEIGGEELTSGDQYKFMNPYFIWEEASDLESGVEGYYVYFGSDVNADPVTDGSFQYGNDYTSMNNLISGSNYLRVSAKDFLGNISNPVTLFEYVYVGVSPVQSINIESSEFIGDFNNSEISGDAITLEKDLDGFWLEERLSYAPTNLGYGAKGIAYVEDSNKLYIPSGMNSYFYEYDIDTDTWTQLADAPDRIYYGGGVILGPDGYIYALMAGNSTSFWRYNIDTNIWETDVSPAPLTVGYGSSAVFDGHQYIYVLRGNNDEAFWRYDTFSDVWETLAQVDFGAPSGAVNNNVYVGGGLTIDLEDEKIYAIQGNYYTGFSVYDMNTNSWQVLDFIPARPYHGASIEFDGDRGIFFTSGNNNPYLFHYDIESEEWIQVSSAPMGLYYGGGVHRVGDSLYTIRGGNSRYFYRYSIEDDSWFLPKRGLFSREFEGSVLLTGYYGEDIVKGDDSNFYIIRGNFADDFLRFDEDTGELVRLSNLPMGAYYGASLGYDSVNKKIYYTGGLYDQGFFVYDIEGNVWSEEIDDKLPIAAGSGSSMAFDGDHYIYLNRGQNSRYFYRFDTTAASGEKWTSLSYSPSNLYYGAELLLKDSYIYTLRGANANPNPLYRYDISNDLWDTLTSVDTNIYNDGFLVDGNNGYFYAARGSNTSEFYKYSTSGDEWSVLDNIPGQVYAGGSAESNLYNKIYMLPGSGSNTYSDALYTYVMSTDHSGFVREGSYESQVHDLGQVYKWANIVVSFQSLNNTNLEIFTATSEDDVEWSEYTPVTREVSVNGNYQYKINSPINRYIKVKFQLNSGDGISTPQIAGYTINYYVDTTVPVNPNVLGLSSTGSADGGESITTDIWYNYPSPSFEWPEDEESLGATDGVNGSGISGYYVYWGDSSTADPETEGTLQEENSFIPEDLVDSTTYYMRIKTIDYAGNISEDILNMFTYKYDSTAPNTPENLSADPSGYTAADNFSFNWDEVESTGAPIEGYCYKTGSTEGPLSIDQCISETSVSNITSYKVGSNNFYVRTKDSAGNYSDYATVSYYYVDSEHAPAPPTNLQVSPVNNTTNSFGFDWDPPLAGTFYGSQSNLSYLYSVNSLPTEYSVSETSLTYLNPGAYATLPGENVFYLITKDEAGNVNYNDYTSVSFFANTVAPGMPINMEIADVSVKDTESWRLALSWDSPEDEGSGVNGYQIYRSVDGEEFYFHSFTSASSLVDTKLVQMTYYYKVKACDDTNNCGAFSEMVSLYPDGRYTEPADLIVDPIISDISPKKATVSWVTGRTCDSKVAYGIETGVYYEEEVSNSDHVVDHALTMNNLTPGTTYFYVVRWTDEDGNTGESEESTFETAPPPSIQEPVVKSLGLTSALINFTTKDAIKVKVLYGETSALGGVVEVYTGTVEGSHNVELADLKDGTKYFYKINTFDIDGSEYEGEIHTFETLPRPEIIDPKIYQVTGTSSSTLLIEWSSNTAISSVVTYYPSTNPQLVRDEVNVTLKTGKHRAVILNLEPNMPYTIIISGRDFMGNEATSGTLSFTTSADTRPPQVYDLEVSTEIIGSGDEATAQLVVSYTTDEPATSQVEYGEGTGTSYAQKSQEDTTSSENHLVILSGLTPSKVYHLRAISKDAEGNIGYSIDKVVVTSSATDNALDLAIQNLVSIFSFL